MREYHYRPGHRVGQTVLYTLKRKYRQFAEVWIPTKNTPNLKTGIADRRYNIIELSQVIVADMSAVRDFVYDLTYIAANKNFVYGAMFDKDTRTFIIDYSDLPVGFEWQQDYEIVWRDRVYTTVAHTEFHGQSGVVIIGEELKERAEIVTIYAFGAETGRFYRNGSTVNGESVYQNPDGTIFVWNDGTNWYANNAPGTLGVDYYGPSLSGLLVGTYLPQGTLTEPLIINSASTAPTFTIDLTDALLQWKMNDNTANTIIVDTLGTANGICGANTSTKSQLGKIDRALQDFTAAQSTTFDNIEQFTLAFWLYLPTGFTNVELIQHDLIWINIVPVPPAFTSFSLHSVVPGFIDLYSADTITYDNWVHVTIEFDIGAVSDCNIYLNGILRNGFKSVFNVDGTTTMDNLVINTGARVDNFLVFDRLLTAVEIAHLATATELLVVP